MKTPWKDKTGLAKWTAVLASVFGIALGLCGANAFAFLGLASFGGRASSGLSNSIGSGLMALGVVEIVAMSASIVGLLAIGMIAAFREIGTAYSGRNGKGRN